MGEGPKACRCQGPQGAGRGVADQEPGRGFTAPPLFMEDAMQLTTLAYLVTQCTVLTERLEALQARNPAHGLFAVSGLSSDLQRVYAVELILMQLTGMVQAEVADAIGNLLETISMTYR